MIRHGVDNNGRATAKERLYLRMCMCHGFAPASDRLDRLRHY
jgi:hypothetical protein